MSTDRQRVTVPTGDAICIVLKVAALLVAGMWGLMYAVAAVLWWLYWR
jgi:hypothetical protein